MFLIYCNDGRREYYGKHYVHPNLRKAWEMQFVLEGPCIRLDRVNNEVREERLNGPVVVASGAESFHGWTNKPNEVCRVLVFQFDEAEYNLKHVLGRSGHRVARFPAKDIPYLNSLYDRCAKAKKTHDLFSLITYHIISLELTHYFLKLLPPGELAAGADFGEKKVVEAMAWYQANLAQGPSIQEVAEAVHLSSTHLRRLFHKVRGIPPQAAFTELQFERAKELMRDRTIPFERVAENAGFGSASAFSRAFKMESGVSPKVFRSKLQSELQEELQSEIQAAALRRSVDG